MKLLDSNEIRQLRDVCIFEVNGIEVYMWFGYQIMLIGYHFDCCFNKKEYLCIVNKYI